MATVLETLFGDIAAAIREKTGDAAVMKPAEFPEQIAAIETGGGSGEMAVYSGTFTATGTWNEAVTVDFGFVPDFLLVHAGAETIVGTYNHTFYGFSQTAKNALGTRYAQQYVYISSLKNATKVATVSSTTFETTDANTPLNSISATGFKFGKTHAAGTYNVLAFKLF